VLFTDGKTLHDSIISLRVLADVNNSTPAP